MRSAWHLFTCAALGLLVVGCRAQPEVPLPLTECIGRLEFGVPGSLDVGASAVTHYSDGDWVLTSTQYRNGHKLGETNNLWSHGSFRVSHAMTPAERKASQADLESTILFERRRLKEKRSTPQGRKTAKPLLPPRPLRHQTGRSWGQVGHAVLMYVGDHALEWRTSDRSPKVEAMFDALDRGARPRKLGEAPQEPGLCLPYVFVPIREAFGSYVDVRYRLLEHPDFEIRVIQEGGALELEANRSLPEVLERELTRNWYYSIVNAARKLDPITEGMTQMAGSPAYFRSVKFVRRETGYVDYGYLVTSAGDPARSREYPSVVLQIRRNTEWALRQDREPMGKEEFFALARAIHASVKLRALGPLNPSAEPADAPSSEASR